MGKIIGINTLFMIPNEVGGTEYHLRSFLKKLETLDTKNSYVVFCNKENYSTFTFANSRWKKVLCPISARNRVFRIIFEQIVLPIMVKLYKCDVLHSYGYFGPIFSLVSHVVTVHDVNWKDHPEDFSFLERLLLTLLIEGTMLTSSKIITDSEFSRKRLGHYFPQHKKKTVVISPGVEDSFLELSKKKTAHPLQGKKYILCVSALYPHKQIPYLLENWRSYVEQNKDVHLVLIGQHGKDEVVVENMVKNLKNVTWYKKVSFDKLVQYYQHADAFVFPSIYEGFGYPVYEALSLGIPVYVGNKLMYHKKVKKMLNEIKLPSKFKNNNRVFIRYDDVQISILISIYRN